MTNVGTKSENDKSVPEPRDFFAAERTLLAWVRTGLAMMGFGFVVARFGLFLRELTATGLNAETQHVGLSLWFGTGLVVLGVVVTIASAVVHQRTVGRLARGEPLVFHQISLGIIVAWTLGLLGLGMAVYLAFGINR
jgi:putative membrane protein